MTEKDVPDEFQKVTKDFYRDILTTFPEYKEKLGPNEIEFLQGNDDGLILFSYCKKVYPERFFDILYKNTDMFSNDEINTKFLPNIEFANIWKEDIRVLVRQTTQDNKDKAMKYLQNLTKLCKLYFTN